FWGLATNGQQGVETVLTFLRQELDLTMALAGCPDLKSITPDFVGVKNPSRGCVSSECG
ncbi:MAG: alpha-hydroxy-acid oxidizing protein, partial [Limisphaerales bacterium]